MPQYGRFLYGDARKIAQATREVLGGERLVLGVPYRPAIRQGGGGACECVTVYEIKFEGNVTGGAVTFSVAIDDGSSVTTENISSIAYNDSAATIQTAFEAHSKIAASGADIDVKGGDLPNKAVYVVFLSSGDLNRNQALPSVSSSTLTGTNVVIKSSYMTLVDWEA